MKKKFVFLIGLVLIPHVSAQSIHTGFFLESGKWNESGTAGFFGDEWGFDTTVEWDGSLVRFSANRWEGDILVELQGINVISPWSDVITHTYITGGDTEFLAMFLNYSNEGGAGATSTTFVTDYVQVEVLEYGEMPEVNAVDFLFITSGGGLVSERGNDYIYGSFRQNSLIPFNTNPQLIPVPEPATYTFVGALCLAGFVARRRFVKR